MIAYLPIAAVVQKAVAVAAGPAIGESDYLRRFGFGKPEKEKN
jgi:hypothetical protein